MSNCFSCVSPVGESLSALELMDLNWPAGLLVALLVDNRRPCMLLGWPRGLKPYRRGDMPALRARNNHSPAAQLSLGHCWSGHSASKPRMH